MATKLDMDSLLEHDQDTLYEARDHCRELIAEGKDDVEEIAKWMQNKYEQILLLVFCDLDLTVTWEGWLALAEEILTDTHELVGYERKHDLLDFYETKDEELAKQKKYYSDSIAALVVNGEVSVKDREEYELYQERLVTIEAEQQKRLQAVKEL